MKKLIMQIVHVNDDGEASDRTLSMQTIPGYVAALKIHNPNGTYTIQYLFNIEATDIDHILPGQRHVEVLASDFVSLTEDSEAESMKSHIKDLEVRLEVMLKMQEYYRKLEKYIGGLSPQRMRAEAIDICGDLIGLEIDKHQVEQEVSKIIDAHEKSK